MAERDGRLLGLDLGERRIGVALSDPTAFLASAYGVLPSQGRARDVAAVAQIVAREDVGAVVVGVPVNMDGSYGPQAEKSHRFGAALAQSGVAVVYWDERLTTVEADRTLIGAGMHRKKRREVVDKIAATLLLQSYLDANARPQAEGP